MPPPNLLYIFIKLSPAVRIKQREKKVTPEAVFGQRDTYKTGKWFVHALNRWMPVRKHAIKPSFSPLHYALEAMPCSREDRCRRPKHPPEDG